MTHFIEAIISIFAIVNPIGNLPVFAGLTESIEPARRRRLFRLAGVIAFVIIAVMAVAGKFVIDRVFHISMTEFRFGGGVLLVVIGIRNMLLGVDRERRCPAGEEISLAVTPIASPLLVGPGSIITVMLLVERDGLWFGLGASVAAFVLVLAVLNWSEMFFRLMGRIGSVAVGRVMQIFIISIGVHFMFQALREAFPRLFG